MTLKQKIGQMTQINIDKLLNQDEYVINKTAIEYWVNTYYVGSFLNNPFAGGKINGKSGFNVNEWISFIREIQSQSLLYNNIPIIYGLDSVHGANYVYNATMFPHNTGLAATFNVDLAYKVGNVAGKDTRTAGVPWAFAPVLGIGKQPLWSRFYETFGEDPFVASRMGENVVRGIQGTNLSADTSCIATLKHYTGYSDPHSGKDRTDAWIPLRYLKRYFLPSFKAAVDAGARSAMVNSGSVNGIPGHMNKQYLTDILIKEYNFTGVIVSDWQDIEKLVSYYQITPSEKEAILLAINAGIDMSMVPEDDSFPRLLLELVQEGKVSEERIDYSVAKILQAKQDLGLFTNPLPNVNNPNIETVGGEKDRLLSKLVALESVTLLKNDANILPLPDNLRKILVTGPASNSLSIQNGGWSIHWQGAENGEFPWGTTIYEGIKNVAKNSNVTNIEGCNLTQLTNYEIALAEARRSDVIILALGEEPEAETPGDINDLSLNENQTMYLEMILKVGKPVVLVVVEARPRIIPFSLIQQVNAHVTAYLPSSEGGAAIAELLFGVENFSGKLPFTFPRTVNDIGVPYYHKYPESESTFPLYKFGHGLSYTTFDYSPITVSSTKIPIGSNLNVSVSVKNSGTVFGKEVVILYLSDLYASISPEVKMVKRFTKVPLLPNGLGTIEFQLYPEDFSFIGIDDQPVIETGDFLISIGDKNVTITLY